MTLKQEIHELVEELPEDATSLREIRETLRLDKAIEKGLDDVRAGRVYTAEEFMAKVRAKWPRGNST